MEKHILHRGGDRYSVVHCECHSGRISEEGLCGEVKRRVKRKKTGRGARVISTGGTVHCDRQG